MLRSLLLAPLLMAAVPLAASTQTEVRAFADAFDRAQIAGDAAALDRMTADDLILVNGSGRIEGKAEFIAGFTTPGVAFDPVTITAPTHVELGPDAAIIGGDVVLTGTANGKPFRSHIRFADTFRRVGGRWQAVHIQVTPIK